MIPDRFRGWRLTLPQQILIGQPAKVTRIDVVLPLRLNLPSRKRNMQGNYIYDEYDLIDSGDDSGSESAAESSYSDDSR